MDDRHARATPPRRERAGCRGGRAARRRVAAVVVGDGGGRARGADAITVCAPARVPSPNSTAGRGRVDRGAAVWKTARFTERQDPMQPQSLKPIEFGDYLVERHAL